MVSGVGLPDTSDRYPGIRGTWGEVSSATPAENYYRKHTFNLHEMGLAKPWSIGSSRPSRPTKFLRSAFPSFMPGWPYVLKEIDSAGDAGRPRSVLALYIF